MKRLRAFLRDDAGMAVPVVIAIVGIASIVIFGTSGGTAAVKNRADTVKSAENMEEQAGNIRDRLKGRDDDEAKRMLEAADQMEAVAKKQKEDAQSTLVKEIGSTAVDAAMEAVPAGKGVKLVSKGAKVVKNLWNVKGGADIAGKAVDGVSDPLDEDTQKALDDITSVRFDGTKPEKRKTQEEIDAYIADAKLAAAEARLREQAGGRKSVDYRGMAIDLVADTEMEAPAADTPPDAPVAEPPAGNPFLDTLEVSLEKVDPDNKPDVAKGSIDVEEDDRKLLDDGERSQILGRFFGDNGVEPVVVKRDANGKYTTEFALQPGSPGVQTGGDLKMDSSKLPPALRPKTTTPSCPFLYAFDGTSFRPVNDLISVSRDPAREYDDAMLFSAEASRGTLEVRVVEVREEESFLDRVSFAAVDVPAGFTAGVTPGGAVLSVREARAPLAVSGADLAALTAEDGAGFAAHDGGAMTALFEARDGGDAVLLLTTDGFEVDAAGRGPALGRRPQLRVDAYADGRWWPAGVAYPRDRADTVALDVSRFVRGGRVQVRIAGASCNAGVYQLLDRLALSTAPARLARVRPLTPRAVTGLPDAGRLLAATDGERLRTAPGDTVRFEFADPGTRTLLVLSRGWYRPLGP